MPMTADRFVHYMTGNAEIDGEHWVLFQQMDKIIDGLKSKDVPARILNDIDAMLTNFGSHVAHENQIMSERHYPYAKFHIDNHESMLTKINEIRSMVQRKDRISEYIITNLENLFINHIDTQDIQLFQYLETHPDTIERAVG